MDSSYFSRKVLPEILARSQPSSETPFTRTRRSESRFNDRNYGNSFRNSMMSLGGRQTLLAENYPSIIEKPEVAQHKHRSQLT